MAAFSFELTEEKIKETRDIVVYYIPRLIKGIKFIVSRGHEFFIDGGIYIRTDIQNNSAGTQPANNNVICFETIIQPDGDITNLIPDPAKFNKTEELTAAFEKCCTLHMSKFEKLMNDMGGVQYIADLIGAVLSVIHIILVEKYLPAEYKQLFIPHATYAAHTAGTVLLFSIRKKIFNLIFRALSWVFKFFRSRFGKK